MALSAMHDGAMASRVRVPLPLDFSAANASESPTEGKRGYAIHPKRLRRMIQGPIPPRLPENPERPQTRGECKDGPRPCPFVSCKHHLLLEITDVGSLKIRYPVRWDDEGAPELEDMPATCALDVADAGGVTLVEVGRMLRLTRERARQLEESSLHSLRRALARKRVK